MKAFFDRYKLSTAAKAMIRELVDIARTRGHDKESDEDDSGQPTILALSDIRSQDVDCIFGLKCGEQNKEVWHLDDSEKCDVPKYLSEYYGSLNIPRHINMFRPSSGGLQARFWPGAAR